MSEYNAVSDVIEKGFTSLFRMALFGCLFGLMGIVVGIVFFVLWLCK